MRPIYLFVLILLVLSCNQQNQQQNPNPSTETQEKMDKKAELEKLRHLKQVEWPQAYREQDTVLLDRILGDDFQMITNDGEWSNKALQMERIKAAPMDHDKFWYDIKRLEILENGTAIIAGTGHMINDSKETIYQSSNVLEYREGVWKAVLSHVSGVKPLEAEQQ